MTEKCKIVPDVNNSPTRWYKSPTNGITHHLIVAVSEEIWKLEYFNNFLYER